MISAKDEFFLDREMVNELTNMIYELRLGYHEQEEFFEKIGGEISMEQYEQLKMEIIERQMRPLTKMRYGKRLYKEEMFIAREQFKKEPNS